MRVFLLVFSAVLGTACSQVARFDNYTVYRLTPKTDEEVLKLRELETSGLKFDFWRSPSFKNAPVDIMVPPHRQAQFQDVIQMLKIDTKQIIDNVQSINVTGDSVRNVQESIPGNIESLSPHFSINVTGNSVSNALIDESTPTAKVSEFGWTSYHRLSDIYSWFDELALKYPEQVSVIIGGKSYEGRDIKGVKVSFKNGNKAVFLEGGIHAREWIAPATVTYILNELLTSSDPAVRDVAESYDWYIFPSVNPDGYEYTHTKNRLWRMTRKPYGDCIGVDPNRNWGYHWNEGGTSGPCGETYLGPEPFSETETRTLSEYIASIHKQLVGYLSIHSYSQLLLIPYGYSNAHVENYEELMEIGTKAIESLAKRYGTKFVVGNMEETIYVASGVSPDWVKGNFKTPITYTYELRDTGRHGFVLPPEQIIPTAEETLDSLVTMMQEAKARGY